MSGTLTQKLVVPKSKAVTVEMTASQGEVTGFRKKEPTWLTKVLWLH